MTITSSSTLKLHLLVLGFVCALQVSSSASLSQPNEPQPQSDDDDAKIDKFRKFATENRKMLSIKREAGHDVISSLEHRQCIAIRLLSSLEYISKSLRVPSSYVQDLIPQAKSEGNDALAEASSGLKQSLLAANEKAKLPKVFLEYLGTYLHSNPGTEDAVKSFVKIKETTMKNNKEKPTDGKAELASYIVPLGEYMYKYDEAIDYITKEYETHCINGVVHHYPNYYLEVYRNSFLQSGVKLDAELSIWINYMATACPMMEYDGKPISKIGAITHLKIKAIFKLDNYEKVIETPREMSALRPYLPKVKDSSKSSELIGQLVAGFGQYQKMNEAQMKAHDEDLWEGYQKKFIVQQTIIRVMREDLDKAKQYLNGIKSKFNAKRSQWRTKPIPELIVHKVARPLYHYYHSDYVKKEDMLKSVLTILFEQPDVQFELPKESELGTFGERKVAIPEEIKMFCTNLFTVGPLLYSQVVHTIVDFLETKTYEELKKVTQDEVWAELAFTIVSDLMEITEIPVKSEVNIPVGIPPGGSQNGNPSGFQIGDPSGSQNADPSGSQIGDPIGSQVGDSSGSQIGNSSGSQMGDQSGPKNGATSGSQVIADPIWYKSPLKWVYKNPFYTLVIVGSAALLGLGVYKIIEPFLTPDLTTPFRNTTSTSPSVTTDPGQHPIVPVWLIVVIIVAILFVGAVFYLICRKKSKKNDSKDKTSKTSKTKKDDVPVSMTPIGTGASSSSPGTSRPRSTKSSLVTSSPVSSRGRPASSPSRIPLIPSRISTPGSAKSALGKPISNDGKFSSLSPASSLHSSTPSYFGSYVSSATASSNFLGGQSSSAMSSSAGGSTLSAVSSGGSTGSNVGSSVGGSNVTGSSAAGSSVAPSSAISRVANSSAASAVTLSSLFSGAGPKVPKVAHPAKTPPKAPKSSGRTGTKSPDGKAPPTSPSTGKGATTKPGTGDPKGVQKKKK